MVLSEAAKQECEALFAIYGDDNIWIDTDRNLVELIIDMEKESLKAMSDYGIDHQFSPWENLIHSHLIYPIAIVKIELPSDYPGCTTGPIINFSSFGMDPENIHHIKHKLKAFYKQHQACLFECIEYIRTSSTTSEYNDDISTNTSIHYEEIEDNFESEFLNEPTKTKDIPTITHGDLIIDRKSVFQGHVARVNSLEEVELVKNFLLNIPKIARATHNIMAYTIKKQNTKTVVEPSISSKTNIHMPQEFVIKDHDSDGETAAGGRLQFLLSHLSINNAVVVVTRWYGGKKLGPDRFKHINNAARSTLVKAGFIE